MVFHNDSHISDEIPCKSEENMLNKRSDDQVLTSFYQENATGVMETIIITITNCTTDFFTIVVSVHNRHGDCIQSQVPMVVRGSQQETLDPGFVLLGTRRQGVPVILREPVLPGGFDLVSSSFKARDVTTELSEPQLTSCRTEM
ncbi:unnamed protein product [Schistosoma curassoni]|uniref:Deleted in lung and esophageal cancer protein 1 n=1 Tax=Schistosoma curassoni TaxID=6186 RepID=A0A183JUC1_9TREM|nr:unnamed protein product [Schistosoma curassoni]